MITLDLEQLVLHSGLSAWERVPRAEIIQIIGENEATYPDIVGYGNVTFDFVGDSPSARLCGFTIVYPAYLKALVSKEEGLDRALEAWPSPKFLWNFGVFQPDCELDEVLNRLPELTSWDRTYDTLASTPACFLHKAKHPVEVAFLSCNESAPAPTELVSVEPSSEPRSRACGPRGQDPVWRIGWIHITRSSVNKQVG